MKILNAEQNRLMDAYTILNEPISSLDLMERAASKCAHWILQNTPKDQPILIYCGSGNNGGDGLVITRMLSDKHINCNAILLNSKDKLSPDNHTNFNRLTQKYPDRIQVISKGNAVPSPPVGSIVVDAIFGTGFKGEATGIESEAIGKINTSDCHVISIDLPSGMASDKTIQTAINNIVKSNDTLTFQYLKPCMVMPENMELVGQINVLDIGLDARGLGQFEAEMELVSEDQIRGIIKDRPVAGHKGEFGHATIMAGGAGKAGAGILAAKSCLRSGCGLITMIVPQTENPIFQSSVPEAMTICYGEHNTSTTIPTKTSALAVGPGIGTSQTAKETLQYLIGTWGKPLIVDADALNLLSESHELLKNLPQGSLLTPHVGEFERLIKKSAQNDFERLEEQKSLSKRLNCIILLKGAFTKITTPEGRVWVNPTGNAGMAKGGSGDVLTGLIAGLAARGYTLEEAAIIGAYLHGLSGDLCAKKLGMEAMHASDIIEAIPQAWQQVSSHKL
ncbi:MAG: NAD(P)H-hydrate dehydratase [Bacteroidota bacterium]